MGTFLEFVTVATLEFSQDPGVIQEALANAVTVTLTVETVIEILNTPDMTEKYGEFEVIGTDTDGTISTLNPTASPTRPPTGSKTKKAKKAKRAKKARRVKEIFLKNGDVILNDAGIFLRNDQEITFTQETCLFRDLRIRGGLL